ncbi:MAG TPA: CHAT domain-containing protein, partial [Candidatus Eisenbacteria bacterium]|jgi:CHAT domain-containing protein
VRPAAAAAPRVLPGAVAGNPLMLSGLVLSGANHRGDAGDGDDGILTAQEIAALDLRGTDWAVLSACRTGMGEVLDGEGVSGLRRAFRQTGVRTVVSSVWPVGDAEAREWMETLYRARLVNGVSTAAAVRAASLERLREQRARHATTLPIAWGAFFAGGDWR